MTWINPATITVKTATLTHNQSCAATSSQTLNPTNTTLTSTSAAVSHHEPKPKRRTAIIVAAQHRVISPQRLNAYPAGVMRASLVAPSRRKSPASALTTSGAASWVSASVMAIQRHGLVEGAVGVRASCVGVMNFLGRAESVDQYSEPRPAWMGIQPRRRRANPDARTARRSTAARTADSAPTTRTFVFARVTAV